MLKLTNVSKYYHSNDVVALGLRKVNLEFKLGEFIAVTGESGSGKSTLLNVLSGLDTYEDGEIYVNGEETSYYSTEEWESYRRQYIGFVFQNYNIIDSYSVLENVMVALTIQGYPKHEIKDRALELIDKVGLSTHIHHKASKLSGGQKQRTVIARALAKDCPIIVCDEPTGNLDSESSRIIMQLLKDISKDKLVIVVTHNYEEVAEFATRRIRLFDGEVVEDKRLQQRSDTVESIKLANYFMTFKNLTGIALKNLFRTPRRTIFATVIGIFIAVIFTFSYGSFMQSTSRGFTYGRYGFFNNVNDRRIIAIKDDESFFTPEELQALRDKSQVNYLLEHDVVLDTYINLYIEDDDYINTERLLFNPADMLYQRDLKDGNLPTSKYEIVLEQYYGFEVGDLVYLGFEWPRWTMNDDMPMPDSAIEFEVVGIVNNIFPGDYSSRAYFHHDFITSDEITNMAYSSVSDEDWYWSENNSYVSYSLYKDEETKFNELFLWRPNFTIDNSLADGEMEVYEGFLYELCEVFFQVSYEDNNECYKDETIVLQSSSTFFTKTVTVEITDVNQDSDYYNFTMNQNTYDQLIDKNPYQIALLVDNSTKANELMNNLEDSNYILIYPSDISDPFSQIQSFMSKIWFGFLVGLLMVIIYFISYVVLKNVQNAKKKDYLIFRSIGASKRDLNKVTLLELFFTMTFAYIITMLLLLVNELYYVGIPQYLSFFTVGSYAFIYFLLIVLGLLLGNRFNQKIFGKSVITSLKQE